MCTSDDAYNILEGGCFITVNYSPCGMNMKVRFHVSVIHKLNNRVLTGQGLGISIHRHTGLEFHLAWNAGAKRGSYENCIVRRCQEVPLLFEILLPLRKSNLVGLCKCIFGTEIGYDTQTATVCYYTEEGFSCRCRVDSI